MGSTSEANGGLMPSKSSGSKGDGKSSGGGTSARSAITGRYVTKATAIRQPDKTVEEKRKST